MKILLLAVPSEWEAYNNVVESFLLLLAISQVDESVLCVRTLGAVFDRLDVGVQVQPRTRRVFDDLLRYSGQIIDVVGSEETLGQRVHSLGDGLRCLLVTCL